MLEANIGKQDQYEIAYGGLNYIEFNSDDSVSITKIKLDDSKLKQLENNLMLFYLGGKHCASEVLKYQIENYNKENVLIALNEMCKLTRLLRDELKSNNITSFGEILHENWVLKRSLSEKISTTFVDDIYEMSRQAGAEGGKLLGAGGAGFLLLYVDDDEKKRNVRMKLDRLKEIQYRIDEEGVKIVYNDQNEGEKR